MKNGSKNQREESVLLCLTILAAARIKRTEEKDTSRIGTHIYSLYFSSPAATSNPISPRAISSAITSNKSECTGITRYPVCSFLRDNESLDIFI